MAAGILLTAHNSQLGLYYLHFPDEATEVFIIFPDCSAGKGLIWDQNGRRPSSLLCFRSRGCKLSLANFPCVAEAHQSPGSQLLVLEAPLLTGPAVPSCSCSCSLWNHCWGPGCPTYFLLSVPKTIILGSLLPFEGVFLVCVFLKKQPFKPHVT